MPVAGACCDEVFAVWGAPIASANGARLAVDAARELLQAADELRSGLVADGLPPVWYGIGLNLGDVVAAHVGTNRHRQYTVIGDAVNAAARISDPSRVRSTIT